MVQGASSSSTSTNQTDATNTAAATAAAAPPPVSALLKRFQPSGTAPIGHAQQKPGGGRVSLPTGAAQAAAHFASSGRGGNPAARTPGRSGLLTPGGAGTAFFRSSETRVTLAELVPSPASSTGADTPSPLPPAGRPSLGPK